MPTSPETSARARAYLLVTDMTVGYGRAPVVQSVSISVGLGEVVSIVGPNGAGKSTLLKGLTGNLPITSGAMSLGDQQVARLPANQLARRGLAYVPQVDDVFSTLTVLENLEMGGFLLAKRQLRPRVEEVLQMFPDLRPLLSRRAQKLSGGERKMLAIARALLVRPTLVMLDEPTAGLSPQIARRVLTEHIGKLAAQGAGVLLVEQRALEALEISDWGYVLVAGRVAVSGSARDLVSRPDIADVFLGQASVEAAPQESE